MNSSSPQSKCAKNGGRFISSSFLFILFLCFLATINELRLGDITNYIIGFSSDDQIRIFIGILTIPATFQRRDLLRRVYSLQNPISGAKIDVKFVFCNISDPDQATLVSLEILTHNDILILNCTENMDNGKTFNYFSSLPKTLSNREKENNPPYHYVMKADDDTYLRLGNLAKSLTSLPRHDLYYGCVVPCRSKDPFRDFMSGMGYLVSWDIVEWLGVHLKTLPPNRLIGPEDHVFANILTAGNRGKNRFSEKPGMYDFPDPPTRCTHALWPGTVAVHLLKTPERWAKTLRYFNVTQDLKAL